MLYLPDGKLKWGLSSQEAYEGLQFMKLLLDPSQESNSLLADPLGLQEVRRALPRNKEPVDAVADYLRGVKTCALEAMRRHLGQDFERVMNLEYHLTIPAVSTNLVVSPPILLLMYLCYCNRSGVNQRGH